MRDGISISKYSNSRIVCSISRSAFLHDCGPGLEEGALLSPVSGVGVFPGDAGADGACKPSLCEDRSGATVDRDELVVRSSSMMAPFALQASNCSFVSPSTPRKSAFVKDRASSGFALLRLASLRSAPLRLTPLSLASLRSAPRRLTCWKLAPLRLALRRIAPWRST